MLILHLRWRLRLLLRRCFCLVRRSASATSAAPPALLLPPSRAGSTVVRPMTVLVSSQGDFRVDKDASPELLNSLLYKMCYYRFGAFQTEYGG